MAGRSATISPSGTGRADGIGSRGPLSPRPPNPPGGIRLGEGRFEVNPHQRVSWRSGPPRGARGRTLREIPAMTCGHLRTLDRRGFTLSELLVVVGVIGVLAAAGVPYFIVYWQQSTLQAGAQELQTIVNRGRQLAISDNCNVTVTQP